MTHTQAAKKCLDEDNAPLIRADKSSKVRQNDASVGRDSELVRDVLWSV